MNKFVHLHVHSQFSLLDGLAKIPELVSRVKELGMDSVAITDHGSMYGAIKFYQTAKKENIKPIIGVETYVAKRSRFDKEARIDVDPFHLVLLAKNDIGYKNLLKLVTASHLEGFYYKPRIDLEILKQYHEGIIGLSACLQGEISVYLRNQEIEKAKSKALELSEIFGKDNFYLELQAHPAISDQEIVNERMIKLSQEIGLPLVATNDSHYVYPQDAQAQEILLCIQTQRTLLEKNRPLSMVSSPDFYLRSPEEMEKLFLQTPEALENTVKIADRCNLEIETGKWILPNFTVPDGENPNSYLRKLCDERLLNRFSKVTDEIKSRLDYELGIIEKKGYSTYFLIVSDFVDWSRKQGITVGPGRGSAAGSLVAYAMGITGLDPFYFNLPFERFLNPQRPSPPDIDLDFADERRDEVIAYVTKKYGDDKVAQIITFGTMEARQAIRDVGRVLGMPYAGPDRIAKMIPQGLQAGTMSIEKALAVSPELATAYHNEKETKNLLELASKLEGVARHYSTHAAGVVISDKKLTDYVPLQRETKGNRIITQYDMYTVGEDGIGLLKMDFLGLRNLSIIQQALKFIKETENISLDLNSISLEDKDTYQLLSSGETTGIFQLESSGMRRYIKELKPASIFDVMAMVALFRPGPMQVIPEFIARKNNEDLITYPDPKLKEVLKQSYGLITYQDDVLLTAIVLAGYSWGDADKLRKAVGKKIPLEMKKQKEKFIAGCKENGLTEKKAEEIFKLIEPFAGYGFNKAHAACYAMIAYQTAYLKAHFPVEFMTALLSAESRSSGPTRDEKVSRAVEECRRMAIIVLPPDINFSQFGFTIEREDGIKKIRFGFSAIKNIGPAAIETILEAKKQKGEFNDLTSFCQRVDLSKVNKKSLESLIKSGAMNAFGKRSAMLSSLNDILEEGHKLQKQESSGQTSLFGTEEESPQIDFKIKEMEELTREEILNFERELLGFYFTEHPYAYLLNQIKKYATHQISELTSEEHNGAKVTVGGMIRQIKKIFTKVGNNEMVFANLEDLSGSIEIVAFPKTYTYSKDLWLSDKIVLVTGKVNDRRDRISIVVDTITEMTDKKEIQEDLIDKDSSSLKIPEIKIPEGVSKETLSKINSFLQERKGDDKIIFIIENKEGLKKIPLPFGVKYSLDLRLAIESLLEKDLNQLDN